MPFLEGDETVSGQRRGRRRDYTGRDENRGANEGQRALGTTGDRTRAIDIEENAAVPGTNNQTEGSSGTEIANAARGDANGGEMIDQSNDAGLSDADSDEDLNDYQRAAMAVQAILAFIRSGNLPPQVVGNIGPSGVQNVVGPTNNIRPGDRRGFSGWQGRFSQASTLVNSEAEGDGVYGALTANGNTPGANSGIDHDLRANVPLNPHGSVEGDEQGDEQGDEERDEEGVGKRDDQGEETRELFYELERVLEREIERREMETYSYEDHQSQDWEPRPQAFGDGDLIYSGDARDGDGGQEGSSSPRLQDENWYQQAGDIESSRDGTEAHNTTGTHGIQQGDERQMPNNIGGSYGDGEHRDNHPTERPLRDWIHHEQRANTEVLFDDNEPLDVNNSEIIVHTDGISHDSNEYLQTTDNMEGNNSRDIPIRAGDSFFLRPSEDDDVFGSVTEREWTSDAQPTEREHQHDDATLADEGEPDPLPEAGGVPVDGQTFERDDGTRSNNTTADEQEAQPESHSTRSNEIQPENHSTRSNETQPDGNTLASGRRSVPRNRARVSNNPFRTRASSSRARLAPGDPFARTFTGRPITDENGYVTQPFNAPGEIYIDPVDWDDDHDRRVSHTFETYRTYTNPRTRVRHSDADKENIAPPMAPPSVNARVAAPNRYEQQEGASREHRPFSFGPLRPVPSLTSPRRNINTHGAVTNARGWHGRLGTGIANIPEERTVVTDTVRPADEPDTQFERRR